VLLLERRDSIYLYRPVGMYKNCTKASRSCGALDVVVHEEIQGI
jgi:hypothetical protein